MTDQLDRLAKETRRARQDAEDALAAFLDRRKRNASINGQGEGDLKKKYKGLNPDLIGDR